MPGVRSRGVLVRSLQPKLPSDSRQVLPCLYTVRQTVSVLIYLCRNLPSMISRNLLVLVLSCAAPTDLSSSCFFKSLPTQLYVRSPLTFFHVFVIPDICKGLYTTEKSMLHNTLSTSGVSMSFPLLWDSVAFFSNCYSLITELLSWHTSSSDFCALILSF